MNKKQTMAAGVLLAGLVVSLGASLIPRLIPRETFWTDEQAAEQGRASTRLHQETFEAANIQEDEDATQEEKQHAAQELAAARARFQHSQEALDRAQFWRRTVPTILRWVGAAVAVLGIFGVVSFKSGDG